MAWQLIYTSAPRLLEAGRSGFGTVARHRAIHPILAAALERDSQFDRSAVRGRVVFAHRIVAAGGSRFHVLSCIRETGADYTGRTNHIAHHLIIDPRELSALGSAAPTPVDICRGMTWRTAWPDAPKWLEASDEISLAQFHPATTPGGAWQAIAGDARYAGVLRPATSSVLIVPPEADALGFFGESQTAAASQAWQATFTNCIQPTDDLSEFRWVAVEAASPMRERATGGRTVLDLTAPKTLPAPPESRANFSIPAQDSVRSPLSTLPAKPVGNLFDAQLAAHTPRAQKAPRRKRGLLPYAVILVLLAAAAIYWGFILFEDASGNKKKRTEIAEVVLVGRAADTKHPTDEELGEILTKLSAIKKEKATFDQISELIDLLKRSDSLLERASDDQKKVYSANSNKITDPDLWLERLKNSTHPTQGVEHFIEKLNAISQQWKNGEPFKGTNKLLSDWGTVESPQGNFATISDLAKNEAEKWPAWLREKANKRLEELKGKQASDKRAAEVEVRAAEMPNGASAKKPAGKVIVVTEPTKPEQWSEFAEEVKKVFPKGWEKTDEVQSSIPLLKWQKERLQKPVIKSGLAKQNETDKEATNFDAYEFRGDQGPVITLKFWDSKPQQSSGVTLHVNLPSEFLLKKGEEAIVTALVFNNENPFLVTDGPKREGDKLIISDKEAKRLFKLYKLAGAMNLEMEFPTTCKDLRSDKALVIKLPIEEKEGVGLIVDFTLLVNGMEKRRKELKESLEQTNAAKSPSWDARQLAEDLRDLVKKHGQGAAYEEIWKRANSMGEAAKEKKVISAAFLADVKRELEAAKSKLPFPDASDPKKKVAGQKDRDDKSAQISNMSNRIEKIRVGVAAGETAKAPKPNNGNAVEEINNHPLLKPDYLPPGDYTISAKPPSSASPLPFIRFTISKP